MRTLVVEDDRGMARLVRLLLEEDGFGVDVTGSGDEGLALALAHPYDAIVLDLGLPDRAGLTILRDLRARRCAAPVLILTGRSGAEDVVRGLDVGADDYLVKPFVNAVFQARLRALVRRGAAHRPDEITCGPLVVKRLMRQALVDDTPLPLSPREFAFVEYLALCAETPVGRAELLEHVWGMRFDPGTNVVDVLVARVRRKLRAVGPAPSIETVHGFGYRLVASPGSAAA